MLRANSNGDPNAGLKLFQGVVSGALLSIPLWLGIGVVVAVYVQDEPMSRWQSAMLLLAAAAEFVLLHRVWRATHPPAALGAPAAHRNAATLRLGMAQLKRPLLLLGLAGAYLHYYFWDVQLQIASLRSVTVFVSAPAIG